MLSSPSRSVSIDRAAPSWAWSKKARLATRRGLKAGDVILKVDGQQIETSSQVPGLIAGKKPGSEVSIEVWRDGGARRLTVRPVEIRQDGERVASTADSNSDDEAIKPWPCRAAARARGKASGGD